jgi:hypothetical protein
MSVSVAVGNPKDIEDFIPTDPPMPEWGSVKVNGTSPIGGAEG